MYRNINITLHLNRTPTSLKPNSLNVYEKTINKAMTGRNSASMLLSTFGFLNYAWYAAKFYHIQIKISYL